MTSERVQRQIDRLLDEAEAALAQRDWAVVKQRAGDAALLNPENADARALLAAANRALANDPTPPSDSPDSGPGSRPLLSAPQPDSFANGRYRVERFLGEGGKKKVYLAHDSLLDRDVAFALIKTEGLDEVGRQRIQNEARAMGRLGDNPHIVTIFDMGQEGGQPYLVLPLMPGGDVERLIQHAAEHKLLYSSGTCRTLTSFRRM